jgi:hypothetical protein
MKHLSVKLSMENRVWLLLHEPVSRFLPVPDRYCRSVFTNRAHRRSDVHAHTYNTQDVSEKAI